MAQFQQERFEDREGGQPDCGGLSWRNIELENELSQAIHETEPRTPVCPQPVKPPSLCVGEYFPRSINDRLSISKLSSSEEIFNTTVPPSQQAISDAGYDFKLKFQPLTASPPSYVWKPKQNIVHVIYVLYINILRKSTIYVQCIKFILNVKEKEYLRTFILKDNR